jgi:hypothetical protein
LLLQTWEHPVSIRLLIAGAAIGALVAGDASAYVHKTHRHHHFHAARTVHHRRLAWAARHHGYRSAYGYGFHSYAPGYPYGPGYASAPAYEPAAAPAHPAAETGTAAETAYQEPSPYQVGTVYVRRRSYHGRDYPADTSPAADVAVRLPSMVDPTSSVTAAPNPNNMSDQVPSRGPDYDGVPPTAPYQ